MPKARKVLKWVAAGLGALLLLVAGTGIAGFLWLQGDQGKAWLARQIEDAASTPGEMELKIGRLEGSLPGQLLARNIVLSDAEGTWLALATLELDWSPWDLLERRLEIDALRASGVELSRLPAGTAAETGDAEADEAPGGLPRLPVKVNLHLLSVDEIALGEAVLGQAARLSLTGRASGEEDGSLAAGLDLRRLDGAEAMIDAELIYDAAREHLTAKIDAREAPGGLVATLLELPGLPGTTMQLNGSGPLDSWQGDFALSLGDLVQAEADLTLAREGEDLSLALDGHSDNAPPGGDPLARLTEGRMDFALEAAWREAARLDIRRLTARNDRLALDLHGGFTPESGAVDLTLAAQTRESPLWTELAGLDAVGPATVDITVTGTLGRPEVTLQAEATGIASPAFEVAALALDGRITATDDLLGPSPKLSFNLAGSVQSPRLPGQENINVLLGDSLPWTLEGEFDLAAAEMNLSNVTLSDAAAQLAVRGPVDLNTGAARLDTEVTLPDVSALQPLTSVGLGGRVEIAGPVSLAGFGREVEADLQGHWAEPSSDIALLDLVADKGMELRTQLSFSNGRLQLRNTSVRSDTTTVDLALTLTPDAGLRDTRYAVTLPDAAFLSGELGADLSGPARAEGTVAGPFDDLTIEGEFSLARASVADQRLENIDSRYRLRLQGADIDGPVSVALDSPFGAVDARTDFRLRSEAATLANLQAMLPGAAIGGEVQVPLGGGEPVADLQGDIADLGPWLQFADMTGSGRGSLSLQLNRPGQSKPVMARADFSDTSLTTAPGAPPITAESLSLRLQAEDPGLEGPASFTLQAGNLARDQMALARVDLTGEGTRNDLALTLAAQGTWVDPFELRAASTLRQDGDILEILLSEAQGNAFGQPLRLRQSARLTLGPDETRLKDLDIVSGETGLSATGRLGGESLALTATLDSLPMKTVNAFWDSGIEGTISAGLEVSGSLTAPVGEARLTATGLRPVGATDLPELELNATADWRDGRAKLAGQLGGPQVTAARFDLEAPLAMRADGSGIELPENGALAGQVDWSGKLASLTAFAPMPQHRLSGDGIIDLNLGGSLAQPAVDGTVNIANGRYESLEYGTVLQNLELELGVTRDKVTLAHLSANDGTKGKISGQGDLSIDPERGFPFDFGIALEQFRAVQRDDVIALLGGSIGLNGALDAPRVEARLTTETVEVNLATDLPPSVATLDVVEIRDGVVQQNPEQDEQAAAVDVELDIVVDMPHRVFVRGRGLDSEWAGRITVEGSSADPKISGNVELVRGQLSLVGKVFRLDKGRVTLPESANSEPSLDVTAVHKGRQLEVTARMSGPLSKPELELTSSPEVPRDEIISRVLFDKSASELTAGEAAQLALAVRDLTGKGGGTDVLGFARRAMGVDVLRVSTTEDGSAAVEAGRYLTDDVYLGVRQGADPGSSSAGVEVELTPNITVESEVTRSGANKSGVRFQLDY